MILVILVIDDGLIELVPCYRFRPSWMTEQLRAEISSTKKSTILNLWNDGWIGPNLHLRLTEMGNVACPKGGCDSLIECDNVIRRRML